jgi:hypothetical protein
MLDVFYDVLKDIKHVIRASKKTLLCWYNSNRNLNDD